MMNIIVELVAYINSNLNPYSNLVIDFFQGKLEEIMIRHEPSQIKEVQYFDGSRIGGFNFSLHTKSLNGKKATDQLYSFIDQLDLKGGLDLNPLLTVKIEPVTSVRFISKTDKNEFIYSSSFKLEYLKRG